MLNVEKTSFKIYFLGETTMINIFGVISPNNVVSALFHGLQQLEADGYASVGITTLNGGQIQQQHTYENPQNWPNLLCEQPKFWYRLYGLGKVRPSGAGGLF